MHEKEIIPTSSTFILKPKELFEGETQPNDTIALIAKNPGPFSCLASVATEFLEHGFLVWVKVTDVAALKFAKRFSNYTFYSEGDIPTNIRDILISADDNYNFELSNINQVLKFNPDARIIIIEDFPGSIEPMIEKALDVYPINMILTTTIRQSELYKKNSPTSLPLFPSVNHRLIH